MKNISQEDSLVAAIEGDYSGMSHSDLALTCHMLSRGREAWRKEAENSAKERDAARSEFKELDEAIGQFQDNLRNKIIEITGCPDGLIDGKGSDAGWEEFTEAEVCQGIAYIIDQRDAVLKERDESRTELEVADCHLRGAQEQRDAALKACAEMRDCLNELKSESRKTFREAQDTGSSDGFYLYPKRLYDLVEHALSTSCGKDYIHKRELGPLVEALKALIAASPHGGEGHQRAMACPKAKEALAHAEKLMEEK